MRELIERRGDLQLQRRGERFEIIAGGVFLMATHGGDSERLLVEAALARHPHPGRVLIGGLGVGVSLRAALADPRVRAITVVELERDVIRWNREHFGDPAGDPRVTVVHADLLDWLAGDHEVDLACIDIDNGPEWLVRPSNSALYDDTGLALLRGVVAPDGVLSLWSAERQVRFERRLRRLFGRVDVLKVAVERGPPDCIYLAMSTRPEPR